MTEKKQRILRFTATLLALFLICVLPLSSSIYLNCKKTVGVAGNSDNAVSVKGKTVSQLLFLEGEISDLTVYLRAPSGELYKNSRVSFRIEQDGVLLEKTVLAQEVESGNYKIPLQVKRLQPGTATITISGEDFPDNTDLFCFATSDKSAGLPAATIEGNALPGAISVGYQVLLINPYFYYSTVLGILLLLLIGIISYLLVYRGELLRRHNLLYWCAFLLIFLFVSINNPMASFLGEPSSESAYEFWYKAENMGFWRSLMSLMSGESLVWTERIIMWVANRISPVKYVFVVAQTMQLLLICGVTVMFCLKTFEKYFCSEIRLLFCFFMGALCFFPSAYYFWSVSYWVSFFIIAFAFVDMESLKPITYWIAIAVTIVFCVSRIYHIVFIPMAAVVLFLLWKKSGKRFKTYCLVVATASAFEVAYSLTTGGGAHITSVITPREIIQFFENSFYYQIQVLISFFFGNSVKMPYLLNAVFLLLFFALIGWFVYLFFDKKANKRLASVLGAMGILSFGTVFINIVVCSTSDTVGFPFDYGAPADWSKYYYQNADLHFSYAYIAIAVLSMAILYYASEWVRKQQSGTAVGKIVNARLDNVGTIAFAVGTIFLSGSLVHATIPMYIVPTDWRSISEVVKNENYYVPINVNYPFALISLEQNSEGVLYAKNADGEGFQWFQGGGAYDSTLQYQTANLAVIEGMEQLPLLCMTVRKALTNFDIPYYAVFKNLAGEVILRQKQTNLPNRITADFYFETPLEKVVVVDFEMEDGSPAYVQDAIQFGVLKTTE